MRPHPWLYAVGGRGFLAGASVLLVGCGGSDEPQGYGPELKQDFVEECTAAGATEETCGCMYDMVEAEIPFARFKQIEQGMRSGELPIPAEIEKFAVDCAAASVRPDHPPTAP